MKTLVTTSLAFLLLVTTCHANSLEIECRLFVTVPMVQPASDEPGRQQSTVDASVNVLITNTTDKTLTIATGAFDTDVEERDGEMYVAIYWQIPETPRKTKLIYPESAVRKVVLQPGESTSFGTKLTITSKSFRRITKVVGSVSPDFADRYSVIALKWDQPVLRNAAENNSTSQQ